MTVSKISFHCQAQIKLHPRPISSLGPWRKTLRGPWALEGDFKGQFKGDLEGDLFNYLEIDTEVDGLVIL